MTLGRQCPNIEGGHVERNEMLVVQTVSHCFNECESVTVNVFLSSGAIRLNCTQHVVQEFSLTSAQPPTGLSVISV